MTGIGASTSAAPVDQASLPASIRSAPKERQDQYKQALAFERALVGQMTESMMKTTGSSEDTPAAVQAMKDQMPGLLADALTSSGGLGLAQQMDAALHPEAKRTSLSGAGAAAPDATTSTAPSGVTGGISA